MYKGIHNLLLCLAEECQKSYEDADYGFNRRDYVCAGSDGKDVSKVGHLNFPFKYYIPITYSTLLCLFV